MVRARAPRTRAAGAAKIPPRRASRR